MSTQTVRAHVHVQRRAINSLPHNAGPATDMVAATIHSLKSPKVHPEDKVDSQSLRAEVRETAPW